MVALDLPKQEVTIDGVKFQIGMLDAVTGSRLAVRLQNTLGTALRGVRDADGGAVIQLAGGVLEHVTPELLSELVDTFGAQCRVETEPGKMPVVKDVFAQFFAGRYLLMYRWLYECLRVNFADFLSEGTIDKLRALAASAGAAAPPAKSP